MHMIALLFFGRGQIKCWACSGLDAAGGGVWNVSAARGSK